MTQRQTVQIDYTNWRGERRLRLIVPRTIEHGSNKYHPTDQWLLIAHDLEKNAVLTFALSGIHSWVEGLTRPPPPPNTLSAKGDPPAQSREILSRWVGQDARRKAERNARLLLWFNALPGDVGKEHWEALMEIVS